MSAAPDPAADHGSLAEEALRLVAALSAPGHRHEPDAAAADAGVPPECGWCPVCRALRVLRVTDPVVREHLAAAGASLLAAAAAALAPPAPMTADRSGTQADEPDEPDGEGGR